MHCCAGEVRAPPHALDKRMHSELAPCQLYGSHIHERRTDTPCPPQHVMYALRRLPFLLVSPRLELRRTSGYARAATAAAAPTHARGRPTATATDIHAPQPPQAASLTLYSRDSQSGATSTLAREAALPTHPSMSMRMRT